MTESPDFQALLAVVAAHPSVVARLGTPVAAAERPLSGNMHLDGRDGDAELRFMLNGPKGRAEVEVEATRKDGRWTLDSLDLE